jgi:mono/diheme cytochrome c family protein
MKKTATLVALFAGFALATSAYAADKKVERMWKSKCSSCHGMDGKGQTEKGKKMQLRDLSSADYQAKAKDEEIKKTIEDGVKKEEGGVKKEMDSYKADLKAEDIDNLVKFVRELKK